MDLTFFSYLLLLLAAASAGDSTTNDTAVLSLFRSQIDLHGTLSVNWTTTDAASTACTNNWIGVNCTNNRVTSLFLPSLILRGPIDALSSLDALRLLDLTGNRLNGTLTPLAQCVNLKLIYLSGNDFSGEIPPEFSSFHRLLRLDLSNNNLRGSIPTQFSKSSRLLTLKLQNNELSGPLPNFLDSLPKLKELNLSNNEFDGILPRSLLSRYGASSFFGNPGLCGTNPFSNCSSIGNKPPPQIVPSNPTSLPSPSTDSSIKHHHRLSNGAVVAIIVANSVLLVVLASSAACYYCCNTSTDANSAESEGGKRSSYSSEKRVYANNNGSNCDSDGTTTTDKSNLVFFDRKKKFQLEELLRASAELLGKGSLGTVYKAVLDDGSTVAVKRLKDANPCGRKEFEQYMDVIGKLRHPNVVKFRAYYYAREEKLLVYDYLPNGSLHSLLHESRGPGRIPLDWTTRISLIVGAARGLSRIHEDKNAGGSRIPHGNVKSSNVLLDKNGIACISDFGLSLLLNPSQAIARLGGYRAPEQIETKRLSQKADVYSFGVLLLEMLTGRDPAMDLPKWVRSVVRDEWTGEVFDSELLRYKNIEEELVSMLHVALTCVVEIAEKRPGMDEVVRMVEEIRVEQSPLGEDYDESRNSLSPSVGNSDDGLG